jgi:hypothetical protein
MEKLVLNFGKIKEYEEAIKKFNELVNKGLTTKRGYQLLTIEDYNKQLYKDSVNKKNKHF